MAITSVAVPAIGMSRQTPAGSNDIDPARSRFSATNAAARACRPLAFSFA